MELKSTDIPGCYIIKSYCYKDDRGGFIKPYHADIFREHGCDFDIKEMFCTWSRPKVFRGYHFQLPPHAHSKIVFCNVGHVKDYVIDLRKKSAVYGKVLSFDLSETNNEALVIPVGCGHGFYVPEKLSMLTYLVETVHEPQYDSGLLWSSLDYQYDFDSPLLSERDARLTELSNFESPF